MFHKLAIFGASALVLAACTTAQLTNGQSDISTGIQAACADVNAVASLVPASPYATYAVAACGTATAIAALVQNSGTIQWLGSLQAQLKSSAPAAAVPKT